MSDRPPLPPEAMTERTGPDASWPEHERVNGIAVRKARSNGQDGTPPAEPEIVSLDAIRDTDFPPVEWAVRDLFPVGTVILGGRPKMGKSWLCLQAAVAKATGAPMWAGHEPEEQANVLYLALEDNARRMKERSQALDAEGKLPVDVVFDWPAWDGGKDQNGGPAVSALVGYLTRNPKTGLVVIDTKTRFRGYAGSRDIVHADYEVGAVLTRVAERFRVCIVLVAHTRKAEDTNDPFAELMGTTGVAAGVATVAVLRRKRGKSEATLFVSGRDITDDRPLNIRWEKATTRWQFVCREEGDEMTDEAKEVLAVLGKERMWPKGVHEALGGSVSVEAIKKRMRRMEERGELVWTRNGGYGHPKHWHHLALPLRDEE